MERIQVKLSSDRLEARMLAAAGPACSHADLCAALAAAGVTNGIDAQTLTALATRLADPAAKGETIVARGTAPEHGADGCIQGSRLGGRGAGELHHDHSIDYRERHVLRPVSAGDVVAAVTDPTAGTPGRDVCGHPIASNPGKPDTHALGDGVTLRGHELIAARDGVILITSRNVDVVDLYTHGGNVDYDSGNLRTRGSLRIQGDICEGFTVEAAGDLGVTGAVLDATVTAGGSITIGQGVLGHGAVVRAGEGLTCRHATAARLVAGKGLEIEDQAAQSRISAASIAITAGRGTVLGGELLARDSIELKHAGSPGGVTTVLAVGQLRDEEIELARGTAKSARLDRSIVRAQRDGRRSSIGGAHAAARANDRQLAEQLRLRRCQLEILRTATIRITGVCHPGVVIRFGKLEHRPDELLHDVTFRFDSATQTIVTEDRNEP